MCKALETHDQAPHSTVLRIEMQLLRLSDYDHAGFAQFSLIIE